MLVSTVSPYSCIVKEYCSIVNVEGVRPLSKPVFVLGFIGVLTGALRPLRVRVSVSPSRFGIVSSRAVRR